MTAPLKVFISYAHADEAHCKTLAKHLSALEDEGLITVWHDRKITGGREWAGAIDDALRSADIVLLLISADFLASDFCYDHEMTRAIERHNASDAFVIPIIVRPVSWRSAPFSKLQALPKDGKPVETWTYKDEAWVNVAEGIQRAVEELRKR